MYVNTMGLALEMQPTLADKRTNTSSEGGLDCQTLRLTGPTFCCHGVYQCVNDGQCFDTEACKQHIYEPQVVPCCWLIIVTCLSTPT
jgi:hypothetical protein